VSAPATGSVGIAGTRHAFGVVAPASPMLRIRYRNGVAIDPHGFPDWLPYARSLVELPPVPPARGLDEARVLDVLTANEVMARAGDPLWTPGARTPAGWSWAHLAMTRRVALVPAELHGAFRHLGGVSTMAADRERRGVALDGSVAPPPVRREAQLSEAAVVTVEDRLGYRLPDGYRAFLAGTNGGCPEEPAVHPDFGFLVDQPFFGLKRTDWLQDLVYANAWLTDRLTSQYLCIAYVQGGLLALQVRGPGAGAVCYWDDDDHRDRDAYRADEICERLLHRCAPTFDAFWTALRAVPASLRAQAVAAVRDGQARRLVPDDLGAALPAAKRPPQAPTPPDGSP
jgi:hypothetical protein